MKDHHPDTPTPGWFDRPESRRLLWRLLFLACGITLIAECYVPRQAHFGFDGWFGFYAGLGFVACAVSILLAKGLGYFLKKPENYYGEPAAEKENPADIDPARHRHDRA